MASTPDTSTPTFFTQSNLLRFSTTFEEMDTFLKNQAKQEGFNLSRSTSYQSITNVYYCNHGTPHAGNITKCTNCPFCFVMTKKDNYFTISSKSSKHNLTHNHELHPSQAGCLSKKEKEEIKRYKQQEGVNNTFIKSLFFQEKQKLLTTKDITKITGTQQKLTTIDAQIKEFIEYKIKNDGERFFYIKQLPNNSVEAVLSIFSDTSREITEIKLIISDETQYRNIFNDWSICPLTILDKNMSNELMGYVIAQSFNYELFYWVFHTLKTEHVPNLMTLVSDNTSALRSVPKELKLGHQKCLWHAEKSLKKADLETKILISTIGHSQHPEIAHDLIEILSSSQKEWTKKVFGEEIEHYTLCLGAQPNYGIVVSSRAESMNSLIKSNLKNQSFYTLLNIEKHLRFVAAMSRQNAKEKKANALIPHHPLVLKLRSFFEPEIVFTLFNQIAEAQYLNAVKQENSTIFYENQKEQQFLSETYGIQKQYLYIVEKQNSLISCSCMFQKTMELPCCHMLKYCADTSQELRIDFCKHWGITALDDVSIKLTKNDIQEIAALNKDINFNKKQKSITGKIHQLAIKKSNENTENINEWIHKITEIKWHKTETLFNLFQKLIRETLNKLNEVKKPNELLIIKSFTENEKENQNFVQSEIRQLKYSCMRKSNSYQILEEVFKDIIKQQTEQEPTEQHQPEKETTEQHQPEKETTEQHQPEKETTEQIEQHQMRQQFEVLMKQLQLHRVQVQQQIMTLTRNQKERERYMKKAEEDYIMKERQIRNYFAYLNHQGN